MPPWRRTSSSLQLLLLPPSVGRGGGSCRGREYSARTNRQETACSSKWTKRILLCICQLSLGLLSLLICVCISACAFVETNRDQ